MTQSRQDVMVNRQAAAFARKMAGKKLVTRKSECCGFYMVENEDDVYVCASCLAHADDCGCAPCEISRAADEDADTYAANMED